MRQCVAVRQRTQPRQPVSSLQLVNEAQIKNEDNEGSNTMTTEHDAIAKGVTDAWDSWLSQHDISVPDTIEVAVRGAVYVWLDIHTPTLIEAIAKAVADRWEAENQ